MRFVMLVYMASFLLTLFTGLSAVIRYRHSGLADSDPPSICVIILIALSPLSFYFAYIYLKEVLRSG